MNLANGCVKFTIKLVALLSFVGFLVPMAYAEEGVKIKWIRTCSGGDFQHAKWVVGLNDGTKVWSHFNPNQGRASMYTLALSAFMAARPVRFENASINTSQICGVTTTHFVDLAPGSSSALMLGDNP